MVVHQFAKDHAVYPAQGFLQIEQFRMISVVADITL